MYLSKRFAALPPRQKRRVRIGFYGGLAALMGIVALGISFLGRPLRHGADDIVNMEELSQTEEVRLLQEYIRIDTSSSSGREIDGAEFLAQHLENAGLDTHVEHLGTDNANLWAILQGRTDEAIVLHNHIDVYPAGDLDSWDFPPFGGVIDQAWIYGRGAFDMKSVAIAQLMAILDLATSGERPTKSVIFLASGSEEIGSELGSQWIIANHPDLADRFSVVLTEGGVVEAITHEEIKYWGIEFAQKWFADGWACSESRERLEALREDLRHISESNHQLRIPTELREFLDSYADSRTSKKIRTTLNDLEGALDHADEFGQLPPYLKSLFRDEIAPFEIEPDPSGNGYRMRIILHLLPGSDFQRTKEQLLSTWATHGVSVTIAPPGGANHGSPVDHPAFHILQRAVQEAYPEAVVGPYFLAWSATDARFFRQMPVPTYGFSPFLIFSTDTFRRDSFNERIDVKGYVEGVEFYKNIIRRLAS